MRQNNHQMITDDDGFYSSTAHKDDNVDLLSFFLKYVVELAFSQRVMNYPNPSNQNEIINYVIKLKDLFFEIRQLERGNKTITYLSRTQRPIFCFVIIPEVLEDSFFDAEV